VSARLALVALLSVALGLSSTAQAAENKGTPKPLKIGKKLRWTGKVAERCVVWRPVITTYAKKYGLDPAFMMAVSRIESGFNDRARSKVGATGLMQVMPSTGRRLKCGDLTKGAVNVDCAMRLMKKLLDYYDGRLVYAIAGYATGLKHPSTRRREGRAPGTRYLEAVMRERSRYLRYGCDHSK